MIHAAILTTSDQGAARTRADTSGDALERLLSEAGATVVERALLPDDRPAIASQLSAWADSGRVNLIVTTGGTGLGQRDVTPEATADVVERQAPGIGEALRAEGRLSTPLAALSRGIAGVRGRCLIVNLPGSPKAVEESFAALQPLLSHAVETMLGPIEQHPTATPS
jgi:molybdenum cofactor synthesis domain-containing protein